MNFFTDILSYPFRGAGKTILLIGALISIASDLASLAPGIGGLAALILCGYFCAMYFQIIESSAIGGLEAPEYPNLMNLMEDMVWPACKLAIILIVSFAPMWSYRLLAAQRVDLWIVWVLGGVGLLYAPMAVLAVVLLGYLGALSPHIVIPSIFRAGWLYLVAVLLLIVIYGLEAILAYSLASHFLFRHLVLACASMYCLMVNGRALGLIFLRRRDELNWI